MRAIDYLTKDCTNKERMVAGERDGHAEARGRAVHRQRRLPRDGDGSASRWTPCAMGALADGVDEFNRHDR